MTAYSPAPWPVYDPNVWPLGQLAERDSFTLPGSAAQYFVITARPVFTNITGMVKLSCTVTRGEEEDLVELVLPASMPVHTVQRIRTIRTKCFIPTCPEHTKADYDTADRSWSVHGWVCGGHNPAVGLTPRDWIYAVHPAPEADADQDPPVYLSTGGLIEAFTTMLDLAAARPDEAPHLELWTSRRRNGTGRTVPVQLGSVASGGRARDLDATGEGRYRVSRTGTSLTALATAYRNQDPD